MSVHGAREPEQPAHGAREPLWPAHAALRHSPHSQVVNNDGFCGSCQLDAGLAKWMSAIPSAAFVVDCGWNMDPALVAANTVPFIQTLRAAQPQVPVVLVEPSDFRPAWILGDVHNVTGLRAAFAAAYATLVNSGMQGLHYVQGDTLLAAITEEPTFEGVHPLDHGHLAISQVMQGVLAPLVREAGARAPVQHLSMDDVRSIYAAHGSAASPVVAPAILPPTAPLSIAAPSAAAGAVIWTPGTELTILGRAFNESSLPGPYHRLPSAAQGVVRAAVWDLSLDSAGLLIGFASTSSSIYLNYTAASSFEPMVHFPATGISGADLYALDEGTGSWRFVAPAQLLYGTTVYSATLATGLLPPASGKPRRFLLHLATYNAVDTLFVGVDAGASIVPDSPFAPATAPIVWYGTSILQGGVSFKVANIFTSRISRALGREIFNLGFSGNCWMEADVVQYLAEVPAPAAFIIDCIRNMNVTGVNDNAVPLVQQYRQSHPTTPVILVAGTIFGRDWIVPASAQGSDELNSALANAYATLVAGGDRNVYYVNATSLFASIPDALLNSPTANGLHPTDVGMAAMADEWVGFLQQLLGRAGE